MGNVFETAIEDFQHAPPTGKILVVVAFITVGGLGIYVARLKSQNTSSSTTTPTTGTYSYDPSNYSDSGSSASTPVTTPTPVSTPTPVDTPTPTPVVAGSHPVTPTPTPVQYVTVQKWTPTGTSWASTLSGIAQHYYGNASLWTKIFDANKNQISNPNLIYPGQRFIVP